MASLQNTIRCPSAQIKDVTMGFHPFTQEVPAWLQTGSRQVLSSHIPSQLYLYLSPHTLLSSNSSIVPILILPLHNLPSIFLSMTFVISPPCLVFKRDQSSCFINQPYREPIYLIIINIIIIKCIYI